MCGMPTSDVADRGDDLRGYAGNRLRLWFQAMWYVTNQKHGVSALGVQRILGLGGYQTAWTWLHKLRRAMVRPGRELLNGEVEVDETYVGGREVGVTGRKTNKKSIVAIAAEIRGRGTGRIRMARVEDASAESLIPFVQTAVCPGATIRTDGWRAYNGLTAQVSRPCAGLFLSKYPSLIWISIQCRMCFANISGTLVHERSQT